MAEDFYETLGVAQDASAADIKSAYRKLAKQYHPDRNPGDQTSEQKFKKISNAYDILKDDQQRAAYDRFGHQAFENGGMGRGGGMNPEDFARGFGPQFSSTMGNLFEGIFGNAMGGGRDGGRASNRGQDLQYDLEISLEDAAKGVVKEFSLTTEKACDDCKGSGAAKGSKNIECVYCGGQGVLHQQSGFFTLQRTCSKCSGMGWIMSNPCKACSGEGRRLGQNKLRIKIPAGIESEAQMRLAGKGSAGFRAGAPGDLFVVVHVKTHKIFERHGRDLLCTVPVPMAVAALGGEVPFPLLGRNQGSVKIPRGCQTGKRLCVRTKGICGLRDSRVGNLYIDIEVETPVNLNDSQRVLLEKFRDSLTDKNTPQTSRFAQTLYDIFERFRS